MHSKRNRSTNLLSSRVDDNGTDHALLLNPHSGRLRSPSPLLEQHPIHRQYGTKNTQPDPSGGYPSCLFADLDPENDRGVSRQTMSQNDEIGVSSYDLLDPAAFGVSPEHKTILFTPITCGLVQVPTSKLVVMPTSRYSLRETRDHNNATFPPHFNGKLLRTCASTI
ncbi:hypothetical protein BLNAU_13611 [Blattamonas nauphoetae]|uniref:Uncharacterized protein n=1 Tax=Blattamonas nauphoetae TaxID=2049346 RepID=A0ABQ9XIB1_9EUKA|nr:hypothetical protein BLNAU_13611 [Blattamonas nauphoetae]